MRTAVAGVHVIDKGEDFLAVAVVVLHRQLQIAAVPVFFNQNRLGVQHLLALVEQFDEGDDAALIEKHIVPAIALIVQANLQPLV